MCECVVWVLYNVCNLGWWGGCIPPIPPWIRPCSCRRGMITSRSHKLEWCFELIENDFLLVRHCLVGAAPEYLMELCCLVSSAAGRQSLRSASRGDLIIPSFRLRTFGFRAFAISGPRLWNSLPLDLRQSRGNLMQFKKKLKTFLFQQFWALLWIQI